MLESLIPLSFDCADPKKIAALLKKYPYFCWLDSGRHGRGRYHILTADPFELLLDTSFTHEDPFHYLKQKLSAFAIQGSEGLPFRGGALGFLSYDLARDYFDLPSKAQNDLSLPKMQIGLYDWSIIIDTHTNKAYYAWYKGFTNVDHPARCQALCDQLKKQNQEDDDFTLLAPFESNLTKTQYDQAFENIQEYLYKGEVYEVNFSQRFSAPFSGSLFSAYCQLRTQINPAYSAYLQGDNQAILCLSPEQFLKLDRCELTTKPIKGTRPRGKNSDEDATIQQMLQNSAKDRAENLMIVDLLRNDFGKVCRPGSIHVSQLFQIETYPNVHHMVSEIKGQLATDYTGVDALKACFPGGSVTGAPKRRAMQIIDTLEPQRRHLYCGSIGYIDFNGNMEWNIAIRTFISDRKKLYCSAGGAIVTDSSCDAEYQETLDKVQKMLKILSR